MKRIAQIEKRYIREDLPVFRTGDTVRVHYRIKEGDKERIQVFQGDVICRRGGGTAESFTVRKISSGIGVERIFPVHSPNIARIERIRAGQVRRKRLYYLRELTGKSARIKEEIIDTKKAKANKAAAKKAAAKVDTKAEKVDTTAAEVDTTAVKAVDEKKAEE